MIRAIKAQWVHPVSRESRDSKDTRVQLAKLAQRAQQVPQVPQVLEAKLVIRVHKATLVKLEILAQLVDKDCKAQLV